MGPRLEMVRDSHTAEGELTRLCITSSCSLMQTYTRRRCFVGGGDGPGRVERKLYERPTGRLEQRRRLKKRTLASRLNQGRHKSIDFTTY